MEKQVSKIRWTYISWTQNFWSKSAKDKTLYIWEKDMNFDKDMNLDKDMTELEFVKIRIISAYKMTHLLSKCPRPELMNI